MLLTIAQYILSGTLVTLAVTLVALPIGFVVGLVLALLRTYGGRALSSLSALYSTLMRSIPQIVLLFLIYFVLAGPVNISPFWAGSLSLGIVSSGYQLEILRGALLAIGAEQMIAARAIGMTRIQAIRYIILPQALRVAIPPWSNEASTVLKDSSLVYALGVQEVLRKAQLAGARIHEYLIPYLIAGLIYFALTFLLNRLLGRVEMATRIPDLYVRREGGSV